MMKSLCLRLAVSLFCISVIGIQAQAIRDESGSSALPLSKISIFSSGLAYYEHKGTLGGPQVIRLPFKEGAVNDALMSLVLNDPASANPSVSYQSEQTLLQTLRSLKIDLSNSPDTVDILHRLRGAEIEISAPASVSGRILGIEYRGENDDPWLSLYTEQGIKMFNLNDVSSLNFKDPQLREDFKRALDLIVQSRNSNSRDLIVNLPGSGSRNVSVSYVIPSPVWKVSYRLDLGREGRPLFQGWAIVDNDSDADWNNVELSLVAGRPVSFIQNLYPPYYLARETVPLAIAGAASAETHDQAMHDRAMLSPAPAPALARSRSSAQMFAAEPEMAAEDEYIPLYYKGSENVAGGVIETANAAAAGDQFEFTVKNPVSLDRRMSAMLPLVEASIDAKKLLIFSGGSAPNRNHHPRLGAELNNTSGMKLPAGPITVYDGGTYAGDALIEFWNEGEKRLISFGEDLSVNASYTNTNTRSMVSVNVSGGVMTFNRSQEFIKTYTFNNSSAQEKRVLVEHPKNQNAVLNSPEADEETPSAYRFSISLPAGADLILTVHESRPISERVTLLSLRYDTFLSYTSNQEIPANIQAALRKAVELRNAVNNSETLVLDAEKRRASFVEEQDRIRKNIEVTGSQTQQGQDYLKRLVSLDNSIDTITAELDKLRADVRIAQKVYEDYLGGLSF